MQLTLKGSTMNEMGKQMELFDEGGLMQEGGTVDPISGNDVPVGSTQEEVRDDIPAQLSEGEFVMPADVVRYHGLDKMMALRDEAKMGLQRMDDMSQMGNSEEAIIPDGVPFGMDDLEMEDDGAPQEFNVGGMPNPNLNTTTQQSMFKNYQQVPGGQSQYIYPGPPFMPVPFMPNVSNSYGSIYQPPQLPISGGPGTTTKPPYSFTDIMPTIGGTSETRHYKNQAGESLYIPFINGEPIYPIPEGYTEYKAEDIADVTPDPDRPTDVGTGDGGNSNDDDASDVSNVSSGTGKIKSVSGLISSLFGTDEVKEEPKTLQQSLFDDAKVFAGSSQFGLSNADLRKATGIQAISQIGGIFPTSSITAAMAKEFDITKFTPNSVAIAGNTAKNAALSHLGYGTAGQLTSDSQASLLGKAMLAGQNAARKGLNPDAAIRGVLDTEEGARVRNESATNLKNSIFSDNINATFAEAAKGATILANQYRDEALDFVNPATNKGIVTSMVYNPTTKTMEKTAVKDTRGNPVLEDGAKKGRDKATATADALDKASGVFSIQEEIENGTRDPVTNVVTADPSTMGPGSVGYKDSYDEDRGDPSGGYPGTDSAPGGPTDTGTDFGDSYNQDDVLGPGEEYEDDFDVDMSTSKSDDTGNNDGGDTGCFITTAIVEKKGEADDGETLTKLRKFRNEYMADKQEEVQEYYDIAPKIVEAIDDEEEWKWIEKQIQKAVDYIDEEKHDDAYIIYKSMVSTLKEKWLV